VVVGCKKPRSGTGAARTRRYPDRKVGEVHLADSGQQVLSAADISMYHSLDHSIELNAQGIKKWNSFRTSAMVPQLADSLLNREFVLKINGTEVCRGKFYSLVSSASYDGVVILNSLMKLGGNLNNIKIDFGYAAAFPSYEESRITGELERFFADKHLLTTDSGLVFETILQ
jgi:hypothetical protein